MDASDFVVEAVIIHDIPLPNNDRSNGPILSGACAPLDANLRGYFEGRVRTSLDRAGRQIKVAPPVEVRPDPDVPASPAPASPVTEFVSQFLAATPSDAALVPMSQAIAQHLFDIQNRATSAGLLVVIRGKAGDRDAVAILKVEREEGLRLEFDEVDGQRVMRVEHLNDITMSEKTKVYKAAVFGIRAGRLVGIASDEQAGATNVLAAYFLSSFLGCEYAEDNANLTLRFFKLAERFITRRTRPVNRATHLQALLSEVQSTRPSLNAADFARAHIPRDLADEFVNAVREEGIPTDRFSKDTALIEGRMSKILWETEDGVRIVAPSAEYGQQVEVTEDDAGNLTIAVTGRIRRIAPT